MVTLPQPLAVVVGVDGSLNGLAAAEAAVEQAVQRRLPLRIAYATRLGHPHSNRPRMPSGVSDLVDAAHRSYPDLAITERIAPMLPSELLLEEAAGAALLVVGSPSRQARDERVGTGTTAVVSSAAVCPVVVAEPRVRDRLR